MLWLAVHSKLSFFTLSKSAVFMSNYSFNQEMHRSDSSISSLSSKHSFAYCLLSCILLIATSTIVLRRQDLFSKKHHFLRQDFRLSLKPTEDVHNILERINATIDGSYESFRKIRAEVQAALTTHNLTDNGRSTSSSSIPAVLDVEALPDKEVTLRDAQLKVNYTKIMMSSKEVNMILRYVVNIRTYLEWGSGGSTSNFAQFASEKAFSIEHNKAWYEKMLPELSSHPLLTRLEYRLVHVPRGQKGWGQVHEFEEGTYIPFKDYVDEIERLKVANIDFVLIDGRARIDCAIKLLSFIRNDSIVVLHDSERLKPGYQSYGPIGEYYDVLDSVGGMGRQGVAVMRRKSKYAHLQNDHQVVQSILDKKYSI